MNNSFKLVIELLLGATMTQAAVAQGESEPPFSEMQGMWYGMSHKVAVEVSGRTVTIKEIDTKDVSINRNGWKPGTVIANYSGATLEGQTYRLSGSCWEYGSNKMSDICFDNLTKYDRPGIKPFSRLHAGSMTLWRREKFEPGEWSARD